MYTAEEQEIMNLADSYTLMYGYLAGELLRDFGEMGDKAVREGTRRYGVDRGTTTRNKHLAAGAKINMKNLFSLYFDLPSDPRFRREKQDLNPQERVSHTLFCPMAEIWRTHGQMDIGRMYCEEFHFACYNTYAYKYTKVNLAKTLTQVGDAYCAFNVILRPESLPEELRGKCFAEYDPGYVEPNYAPQTPTAKEGFQLLTIKLYYYLLEAALEILGEKAIPTITQGIFLFSEEMCRIFNLAAASNKFAINGDWLERNFPISINNYNDTLWDGYTDHDAKQIMVATLKIVFSNII